MNAPFSPLTFRCDDCRRTFTQAGAERPGPIYCPHCGGRGYEEAIQPARKWAMPLHKQTRRNAP